MWGEYMLYGQAVTTGAMGSCGVMILGALLAAANDLTFSFLVRKRGDHPLRKPFICHSMR
jgi:hypothetical protein